MMKKCRSNVIHVSKKGKKAAFLLVIPHLDFVVITTGNKQWLIVMEMNSTDRTFMFVKLINECAHAIIPQLNPAIMQ